MIRIDHISFGFTMADEQFAHTLYADWDNFCRTCLENVVEECLSAYDEDKVLHEIELPDLDLGGIPQEDFYSEFPQRLKGELLKALSLSGTHIGNRTERGEYSRLENLLFYLEHGFCRTEWSKEDYSLSEELEWLAQQPAHYTDRLLRLCVGKEYALRRLLWQTEDADTLLRLYTCFLATRTSGLYEKRRWLGMVMEISPELAVRFVHEAKSEEELAVMAELLDTTTVRRMIETETEEHAEVDIPPYWHYLYEWLIRYYPFNGLSIFGGKSQFTLHLHKRLLAFIRKRDAAVYLSKAELTIGFLLEVFGHAYYVEVLNAIYDLQPHNVDGSPVYDSYFNRELYRTFLQLSLLKGPDRETAGNEDDARQPDGQIITGFNSDALSHIRQGKDNIISQLQAVLTDGAAPQGVKYNALRLLAAYYAENDAAMMPSSPGQDFEEWIRQADCLTEFIRILVERHWKTGRGLIEWLDNVAVSRHIRQTVLQGIVCEHPRQWVRLLGELPAQEETILRLAENLSATTLLRGMAQLESRQAMVLSQTVEWLQRKPESCSFLSGSGQPLSVSLSRALLLYMQDKDTLGGRTMTTEETLRTFFQYLYMVCTGKTATSEQPELSGLLNIGKTGIGEISEIGRIEEPNEPAGTVGTSPIGTLQPGTVWADRQGKAMAAVLACRNASDTAIRYRISSLMEEQPEGLLDWLKSCNDLSRVERLAEVSDQLLLEQWVALLSKATGVDYSGMFRNLMCWTVHRAGGKRGIREMAGILFSWIREPDRQKQTPEQMKEYFMLHLSSGDSWIRLLMEQLSDNSLPDATRKRLLHDFLRLYPGELSAYIRKSLTQNTGLPDKWPEWLDINDWIRLAADRSLSQAELLRQIVNCLAGSDGITESDLRTALAQFFLRKNTGKHICQDKKETINLLILSLPSLREQSDGQKHAIMKKIENELRIPIIEGNEWAENEVEISTSFLISNAGLCLLAPWFLKLFELLGYLNEDKTDFRNTELRIRAVFLLQYLVGSEEKAYREPELAFNRILLALPMHIPLPKQIELTEKEKNTADSMLVGIKSHCGKMQGTSVEGFQQSFLQRTGRLELQEKKWLLTVTDKAYDIMLDYIPWSFRQIRFPWLKKYIQVHWHEKQEF